MLCYVLFRDQEVEGSNPFRPIRSDFQPTLSWPSGVPNARYRAGVRQISGSPLPTLQQTGTPTGLHRRSRECSRTTRTDSHPEVGFEDISSEV
jgi:hypothetical protein